MAAQLLIVCLLDWHIDRNYFGSHSNHIQDLNMPPEASPSKPTFPGQLQGVLASLLLMSGWRFFVLKSTKVEPPSNSEMVHSYFLLRGRLAFVWRETHIVGWLATVGERSLLVIHPYIFK